MCEVKCARSLREACGERSEHVSVNDECPGTRGGSLECECC